MTNGSQVLLRPPLVATPVLGRLEEGQFPLGLSEDTLSSSAPWKLLFVLGTEQALRTGLSDPGRGMQGQWKAPQGRSDFPARSPEPQLLDTKPLSSKPALGAGEGSGSKPETSGEQGSVRFGFPDQSGQP